MIDLLLQFGDLLGVCFFLDHYLETRLLYIYSTGATLLHPKWFERKMYVGNMQRN